MNTLHMVCGLPASGKSAFVEYLFGRLITAQKTVAISRDSLHAVVRSYWYEPHIEDLMKMFEEMLILEYLRHYSKDVVIDNPCVNALSRSRYIDMMRQSWAASGDSNDAFRIFCYWMNASTARCLNRENVRNKLGTQGPAAILKLEQQIELPRIEEGFNEVFFVEPDFTLVSISSPRAIAGDDSLIQ